MRITVDTAAGTVTVHEPNGDRVLRLDDPEAFRLVSDAWLRAGWDAKHVYSFTWFGRPVIQLPEDLVRMQEVVHAIRPDVLIETGVAHGGSLVFYASLMQAMGVGRVIGIDVEIRPHNRRAIESHPLAGRITLVEGDSTAQSTVTRVRALVKPGERVLLALDSNHTKAHVRAELDAYAPLVSVGSYAVVMDGIMESVVGAPRTRPEWAHDNPRRAALEFVAANPSFVLERPPFLFNEGAVKDPVTYWPDGWLKRVL